MSGCALEQSLEALAARVGDPAQLIYRRLFEMAPDTEALFLRDGDGGVRAEMMHRAFDAMLDLTGAGHYARGLIATEWVNHQGLGVPESRFALFFRAMAEIAREQLGADWTPDYEAAWQDALARIDAIIDELRAAG